MAEAKLLRKEKWNIAIETKPSLPDGLFLLGWFALEQRELPSTIMERQVLENAIFK